MFCGLCSFDPYNEVHLLSLHQDEAQKFESEMLKTSDQSLTIDIDTKNTKKKIISKPYSITNDPQCLLGADIVIIALPSFAHSIYLHAIKENVIPTKHKSL